MSKHQKHGQKWYTFDTEFWHINHLLDTFNTRKHVQTGLHCTCMHTRRLSSTRFEINSDITTIVSAAEFVDQRC